MSKYDPKLQIIPNLILKTTSDIKDPKALFLLVIMYTKKKEKKNTFHYEINIFFLHSESKSNEKLFFRKNQLNVIIKKCSNFRYLYNLYVIKYLNFIYIGLMIDLTETV